VHTSREVIQKTASNAPDARTAKTAPTKTLEFSHVEFLAGGPVSAAREEMQFVI
jgi:hypothetical protein